MTLIPGPKTRMTPLSPTKTLTGSLSVSLLMAALIALGAQMKIDLGFTDVPVTLQVFFVLLAGGLLGARLGVLSVAEYLMAGLMGAPVFAGGLAGPSVLAGPTGGYLIGFLAAVAVVGYASDRGAKGGRLAGGLLAGVLLIHLCGAVWLHYGFARPWPMTLGMGVLPFVAVDTLKALAAWAIISRFRSR